MAKQNKADNNEINPIEDQEKVFIEHYFDCLDVREAGKRAGYSDATVNSGYLYQKFGKDKFKQKLLNLATIQDIQDIALVYSIERKALQEILEQLKEPKTKQLALENISKLKHIPSQKKQILGILSDTKTPQQITINIDKIQGLWSGLLPNPANEGDTIDVTPNKNK